MNNLYTNFHDIMTDNKIDEDKWKAHLAKNIDTVVDAFAGKSISTSRKQNIA